MWLLSTDRAELRYFPRVQDVKDDYAILSHTWGEESEEQSFQTTQALRERCATTGVNPRDFSTPKIRECCILAERHGYKWVWIDTCCIDKTSSAELSEAINSMFDYYAGADVCYAYLRDVVVPRSLRSRGTDHDSTVSSSSALESEEIQSTFKNSRWHSRGWTLQELIAPEVVVFLSSDWEVLGTKSDLAELLEEITDVPAAIYRLEEDFADVSLAARMSWMALRQTTRLEDEAYCLMGLFRINMPTLYGEGRQAFRRLQEEIMKQSTDTSLFAWGDVRALDAPRYMLPFADNNGMDGTYLLAPNPYAFKGCGGIRYVGNPPTSLSRVLANITGLPSFSITPYGIHARIPVLTIGDTTMAVLFCTADARQLGLLLCPADNVGDPTRPLYHTCRPIDRGWRLTTLDPHWATDPTQALATQWSNVHFAHRPLPRASPPLLINRSLSPAFRVPRRVIKQFATMYWNLDPLETAVLPAVWTGVPPVALRFRSKYSDDFAIQLGRCCTTSVSGGTAVLQVAGPHWANAVGLGWDRADDSASVTHRCPEDHVCEWEGGARAFRPGNSIELMLSFNPCALSRGDTLVLDVSVLSCAMVM